MERTKIRIWDLPLRLFHWLLVIAVVAAYVSGELGGFWLFWHARLGLFILALIVFRIAWGFLGSTYARFASFFPTPTRLSAFISSGWSGIGHNPLGALSVFALLGVTLAQAGLGLFIGNDDVAFHGPLSDLISPIWTDRLTGWHGRLVTVLAVLIGLHLIAIGYYTCLKHKNLVYPMITGNAWVADKVSVQTIYGGGKVQLMLAVTIAGMAFWCIESGAMLRWFSPTLSDPAHTTTVPSW